MSHFAVTFKNFFDGQLKDIIKSFPGARYDNESKAWIIPLSKKNEFCQVVAAKCV